MVNVHEARTHLSRLLEGVAAGEEAAIAEAGKPVARLLPEKRRKGRAGRGVTGRITVRDGFYAPLLEDVLRAFEGRSGFSSILTLLSGGRRTIKDPLAKRAERSLARATRCSPLW